MILVIRISGLVEVSTTINETLYRMHLHRKYAATLLRESAETKKLLQKVRNFVAFGQVDAKTLSLLIEKRGQPLAGIKIDAMKVVENLAKKNLDELGLKPFFRLHPPRGGIDSKVHFPLRKGVLGDNKEKINELVRRML